MRRLLVVLVVLAALVWGIASGRRAAPAPGWSRVGRDLEERQFTETISGTPVTFTAFRTLANRVHLVGRDFLYALSWRMKAHARVAVNGGYFDDQRRPLGLRVSRHRVLHPVANNHWSVFWVSSGRAHIGTPMEFATAVDPADAVQCGPRLVANGIIGSFKAQSARRTGVGVDAAGRVVIAVADGPVDFDQWAREWVSPEGMGCLDALNLDGGGSTQISAEAGSSPVRVEGLWAVPDALVIR